MFHYVYLLVRKELLPRGLNYYIGARSSKNEPMLDNYMGSGTLLPKTLKEKKRLFNKHIIIECQSRDDALLYEREFCDKNWVENPETLNLVRGGNNGNELTLIEISNTVKKLWNSEEYRTKQKNLVYLHTSEVSNKRINSLKEFYSTDKGKKLASNRIKELWKKEEYRKNNDLSYLLEEEVLNKRSKSIKDFYNTEEGKQVASERMKKIWGNEEYKKKNDLSYLRTDEVKKKQSEGAKKQFSTVLICPKCGKEGKGPWMYQKHFKNCKCG